MKIIFAATAALGIALSGNALMAACDDGEMVIKLSHVTNTDKHPKGIAASLLQQRVNDEMNGKACMEVYPNSTLYNDNQVLEAMLQGDVQMAAPSLSKFEQFTKVFRIFDKETKIHHHSGEVESVVTPEDPLELIESEMKQYKPVNLSNI